MTRTRSLVTLAAIVAAATLLFWLVLHEISGVWLDVALRPEVRQALEQSMEDQKKLRELDPASRDAYRRRFEESRQLANRIEVIRMNREAMLRRFELALLVLFAIAAVGGGATLWLRYRRAQERERREYLDRVTSLQETARRHAHELKGPLTAARLELERLAGQGPEVARVCESVGEELERLARFARELSAFTSHGEPVLRRESLGEMVQEFCATFANAWPNVALHDAGGDAIVCADRDMIRQVLVNLCTNSARAGADRITFAISGGALDVRDTGSGIPDSLRARVFDPYVTTRGIGEGMGLGLSISRKVMLDHGGDLELVDTSPAGTTFRLKWSAGSLPAAPPAASRRAGDACN